MAYVPPALRKLKEKKKVKFTDDTKPAANDQQECDDEHGSIQILRATDICAYFWPTKSQDVEGDSVATGGNRNKTLHASENDPNRLKFILLFENANPRWATDQIIFVKSNLNLLPQQGDPAESTPSVTQTTSNVQSLLPSDADAKDEFIDSISQQDNTQTEESSIQGEPILVFEQKPEDKKRGGHAAFVFSGYYRIKELDFLGPNSSELLQMLDQKWRRTSRSGRVTQTQRDAAAWKKSIGARWAVVKLEKDEVAEKELGPPDIKPLSVPDDELGASKPKKTVNELLKEMRLMDAEAQIGASEHPVKETG